MFRSSVLLCALLFTAPTLWAALVDQTISVDAAIVRFLIAIPVAAALLGLVRMAMRPAPPAPVPASRTKPSGAPPSAPGEQTSTRPDGL